MSSATSQLSALVALIADATKTVEALFQQSSKPFVPSLDDTTPHPFDTEISSIELRRAIQTIEGACAQLCATVARPNHTMINKLMGSYEPACLRVAVEFKIPDVLQEKPSGMHISELGKKTGVEVGKLSRVLRLLATKHCFREVSTDVFANNRISLQLLSSNPVSSLAFHLTDENTKATSMLAETLADKAWVNSYAPEHSPWNKWSKFGQPMWVYWESDNPKAREEGARFGVGMIAWGSTTEADAVIKQYPWGKLDVGASVCDVGGGVGNIAMQLGKAYPNLKLKLQDTPERIQQASTKVWPKEFPEAIRDNRIEFKPMDFLIEAPIKGCDVYYLKNIIHDWSEKESVKILSGIREAMKPSSRVLIHEYILQPTTRVSDAQSNFRQAPEPLLPNYGVGRIRQYNLDINMMIVMNSRERRLEEFVKLGEEAGLRFEKLWDLGELGMVEFRLP